MKQTQSIVTLCVAGVVLATAVTYGIGFAIKLPLPLVNDGVYKPDYAEQNRLMSNWDNVRIYTPHGDDEGATYHTEQELLTAFSEIEEQSFKDYITNNSDLIAKGYGRLMIDKVTLDNTETGIRTTQGDIVLGLDSYDCLMVVGVTVGGNNGKLAVLKNKEQIGLSVVEDLVYWDRINKHATRENAILAINASSYSWNTTGNYGTLTGLAVRNGDLIRRTNNADNVVGFTKEGVLQMGGSLDTIYNGVEGTKVLIQDGAVADLKDDTSITARTVIGQKENGDIVMLVVDGDESNGATLANVVDTLVKYEVTNAISLSEGKCSTMWWNGRIVNRPSYEEETGIKIPTSWVVRRMI